MGLGKVGKKNLEWMMLLIEVAQDRRSTFAPLHKEIGIQPTYLQFKILFFPFLLYYCYTGGTL
jgi:hypothetical protein